MMEDFIAFTKATWNTVYSFLREELAFFFGGIDFSVVTPTQVILDIALLAIIFGVILRLVSGTRAAQVLIGILILTLLYFIATTFELLALKELLSAAFTIFLVAIPVAFQPELRRGLEKLGQAPFFVSHPKKSKTHRLIKEVKKAVYAMTRKKHGALIVFELGVPLTEYADTGIILNAIVSKEFLQSIFFPKSPLHDGAVIIRGERAISAGAVLPFSHTSFGSQDTILGTRHRSAIGLTEVTDALVVVLSEERGEVSFAIEGKLEKDINIEQLERRLQKYLGYRKK